MRDYLTCAGNLCTSADALKNRKLVLIVLLCLVLTVVWAVYASNTGQAQEEPKYVGSDVCATCHADVAKTWAVTVHRRTLFNTEESKKGCESCHGPGGPHVAAGGDPTKIIRFSKLDTKTASDICLKCHTNQNVTMWHTSMHASAKVSCHNCHDPHQPGEKVLLKDLENGKLDLLGLTRSIEQARVAQNIAPEGSQDKEDAGKKIAELETQRDALREKVKGTETVFNRVAQPFMCFNCHKAQEVQSKMVSHHPILEGKVNCSSCHDPHGGLRSQGMLREESVIDTCFRCHADKVGPFTFEHPPVTEDCTTCHQPHGSVQNNLLVQSEPFVCLKCHAGPHSRSNALGSPVAFSQYYTECTDCHNMIHGSDEHPPLHY